MDPFERQLRDLPWKKPPESLRDRLFAPEDEKVVVPGNPGWFRLGLASAAAVFIVAASSVLLLQSETASHQLTESRKNAEAVENQLPPPPDPQPLEIASNQTFFDFSAGSDNTWPGPLSLQIK